MQQRPLTSSEYEFLRRFRFGPGRAWDDDAEPSDAAVSKVMLLGDIHNSRRILDAALRTASDEGCDAVVQVGDFWLQDCTWHRYAPEEAGLMSSAVHAAIPVVVVDGNHEVWPCLSEYQQRDDIAAARQCGRPHQVPVPGRPHTGVHSYAAALGGHPGQHTDGGAVPGHAGVPVVDRRHRRALQELRGVAERHSETRRAAL